MSVLFMVGVQCRFKCYIYVSVCIFLYLSYKMYIFVKNFDFGIEFGIFVCYILYKNFGVLLKNSLYE